MLLPSLGISVANIALLSAGEQHQVMVRNGEGFEPRTLELGARGPARSQVLGGLIEGDQVLLIPASLPPTANRSAP